MLNLGAIVRYYRILRVISRDSFGAVYEAEDTRQIGHLVMLKERFDPTGMASFQGEFTILQQHPHLPRYEDMFVDQGNGYLVMERISGQSLEELIAKAGGPLQERKVLDFALQLCEVLDYLHHQNPPILHLNLKPDNVRLTPSGGIILLDFGLSKQGTDTTKSSEPDATHGYAPVELFTRSHIDPRSDIYSLGATLYHLLTGDTPVLSITRMMGTTDPLVPPGRLNPRISPHIATAISKAMSLDPMDRYSDIAAFRQALLEQPKMTTLLTTQFTSQSLEGITDLLGIVLSYTIPLISSISVVGVTIFATISNSHSPFIFLLTMLFLTLGGIYAGFKKNLFGISVAKRGEVSPHPLMMDILASELSSTKKSYLLFSLAIFTSYALNQDYKIILVLSFLLLLSISRFLVLRYRIIKGYYGTNEQEAREIIHQIESGLYRIKRRRTNKKTSV